MSLEQKLVLYQKPDGAHVAYCTAYSIRQEAHLRAACIARHGNAKVVLSRLVKAGDVTT